MTTGETPRAPIVLAIDPGREKCGLALVDWCLVVKSRAIVPRREIVARALEVLDASPDANQILLGDSTQSEEVRAELLAARTHIQIQLIDERNSTLEARAFYWKANPPRGWRRLLPLSLLSPPEPLDDWAAVVLAHRFFAASTVEFDRTQFTGYSG